MVVIRYEFRSLLLFFLFFLRMIVGDHFKKGDVAVG